MATKSSTQAILAMVQDTQKIQRVHEWRKTTVEFYSDYVEVEYRIYSTLREIPDNNADEWRMFASDGALVLVLTYYLEEE